MNEAQKATGTWRCGQVALVGRPNVGKSTLLNRLLGQPLSIVTHKAQTTRQVVLGVLTLPGGQLIFLDTPGIHQGGKRAINQYMNRSARGALHAADAVLCVFEAGQLRADDNRLIKMLEGYGGPAFAVLNKIDQVTNKKQLLPMMDELATRYAFEAIAPVSARTGEGIDKLPEIIISWMPESSDSFKLDYLTSASDEFRAAEMIREQLLLLTHQEVPYRATVTIEEFEHQSNGRLLIRAIIWVERDGQKAVVIGKDGAMLKRIGSRARLSMQQLFKRKVHLDLWVKLKPDWSDDLTSLRQLGYGALK